MSWHIIIAIVVISANEFIFFSSLFFYIATGLFVGLRYSAMVPFEKCPVNFSFTRELYPVVFFGTCITPKKWFHICILTLFFLKCVCECVASHIFFFKSMLSTINMHLWYCDTHKRCQKQNNSKQISLI